MEFAYNSGVSYCVHVCSMSKQFILKPLFGIFSVLLTNKRTLSADSSLRGEFCIFKRGIFQVLF